MGRTCEVCGKGTKFGNQVSHSHRRTKRTWKVNLISIKALVKGAVKRMKICTRCLRSGKVQKVVH